MQDWDSILRQYETLVWRTAYRLLGNEADAADCFQETFLSAMDVVKRQAVNNWAGLLQRLATARALDGLRRRLRRRQKQDGTTLEGIEAEQLGPLQEAQAAELGERLMAAVAELPEQQGQVFCLRHFSWMSYEQIGAELGIVADGVGTALFKARAKLRVALGYLAADECGTR